MFDRIKQIFATSAELLSAETALVQKRLQRFGVLVAFSLVGLLLAGACVIGILVGTIILITPAMGAGPAVLLVSGGALLILAIVAMVMRAQSASPSSTATENKSAPEVRVERSKHELQDLLGMSDDRHKSTHSARQFSDSRDFSDTLRHSVEHAVSKPAVLVGAAFAVVSVLGVGRTIRLARSAFKLAATGALAYRAASTLKDHLEANDGHHRHNGSSSPRTPGENRMSGRAGHDRNRPLPRRDREPGMPR